MRARPRQAAADSAHAQVGKQYRTDVPGTVAPSWYWAWGIVLLLPVWLPQYLPTEDGLAHLYWIEVYRSLGSPDSIYTPFFVRNLIWDAPYHILHFGLQYGLASILEPHLAQRIVISLAILSWVAAIHFLARAVSRDVTLGAFATLLLIHSSWLYNGFFAFMGAMPLVLVALGLLTRLTTSTRSNAVGPYLAIGLLGIVAHYAHFFVGALFLMLGAAWLLFPWRPVRLQSLFGWRSAADCSSWPLVLHPRHSRRRRHDVGIPYHGGGTILWPGLFSRTR